MRSMDDDDYLAGQFEANRAHLRAVAYRMLGSMSDADDAVQESWFRLSRSGASQVQNLGGWLTTVVARVCLDMLRARGWSARSRWGRICPSRVANRGDEIDPEHEVLLADSVGPALLVVLETLAPAERLAFVLRRGRGADDPVLLGQQVQVARWKRPGRSLRLARSPVAPNITMMWSSGRAMPAPAGAGAVGPASAGGAGGAGHAEVPSSVVVSPAAASASTSERAASTRPAGIVGSPASSRRSGSPCRRR